MDNSNLEKEIDSILKSFHSKRKFIYEIKKALFQKEPEYRIDFDVIILRLQNKIEDIFDRILRCYTRPKQKEEYLYDDEIMKEMKVQKDPEMIRKEIILNLGFAEKKSLIYKTFKISAKTKQIIDKLNEVRNAIAHRYSERDRRFLYKQKNILDDDKALKIFLYDCLLGVNEILEVDTKLLDAIDRAEKELG